MIRKSICNFLCWLPLFLTGFLVEAQEKKIERWQNMMVEKTPLKSHELTGTGGYFLVRISDSRGFHGLRDDGLTLVRKLDNSTAIVRLNTARVGGLTQPDVKLWKVNNDWKLSGNIEPHNFPTGAEDFLVKSVKPAELKSKLSDLNIPFKELGPELIRIRATGAMLKSEFLPRSDIYYIGRESMQVNPESRVLDMNLNPNAINRIHHDYPELDGRGMVLSIREGMFDIADMDLRARHLASPLEGDEPTLHATEMATIAAGAGNSSLNGRGVAKGVWLTSSFLEELVPDADADYQNLNVWVQNHSYGTSEIENFYGAFAEAYDLSANANPDLLHVFSAGNLGTSTPETGVYQGSLPLANMTGNFKMSKNTLAVASVDTVGREVNFVSRGPAHDGRVKPELVTYSVAGSSNSAALVSGVSILLQQAYQEIYGELPPSALLKALLINSAVDVGATGPDYVTGYGNVNAYRSLENLKKVHFFSGSVAHGESRQFNLAVPANALNLKVTLVWNDPAANANANIALVNDLDLMLTDGGAQQFLPWVLNPAPEQLSELAIRSVDRLNNVEQVTVSNPMAGTFTIQVNAFDIPDGVQDFYIVWQWDEADSFNWSFPTGSDNMPYNGETVSYFRWNSTFTEPTGRLEYSINNGMTWELIDAQADLGKGGYRWDAPQVRSAALARMLVGGEIFTTDPFTISRPERIRVGFSCADSVRLQWNKLLEAEAYQVYTFGDASLAPIATVTDTSYTFSKSAFHTKLFSVRPVLADGGSHIRASTIDYDFQGVGCYLISFFAQPEGEEGVRVNLDLGTVAGISEILIERQIRNEGFLEIGSLGGEALASGTDFFDENPDQGLNQYRALISFQNGEELTTEVSSTYFLTTEPFLVFPNPVPRGDRLNVFSRVFTNNPEVVFTMYDHSGQPLFNLDLNSERMSFSLDRLQAGIYFYKITTNGYSHKGRVILE